MARKTSNGYYTNDCYKSLNKLYDNYYEDFKRFFEVVSEKREGTHDFYDHYKGETYLALRISYYGKWLNGDWELRNTKAQLIEKGKYLYDKRVGQWQINRYKEPSYTDKDRQVIKRFYQYREDKIHSSMAIYQTFDGETNKLKEERIKCIGEVNIINEYDEEGRIKTQKHSLKEFNRTRN